MKGRLAGIGGPRTVEPRDTPCLLAPWQNAQFATLPLYIAAPELEVVVGGTVVVVVGGFVVVGGDFVVVEGVPPPHAVRVTAANIPDTIANDRIRVL